MSVLITTTVGLDADIAEPQKTIHLVAGDSGTRALRLIPVSGGQLLNMEDYAAAKVRLHCAGHEDLLIDCTMGDHYADFVPTPAVVVQADEWDAQLVLLDAEGQTVSAAPFTVIVHGTVYQGDAVEHTDSSVVSVAYDEQGRIVLVTRAGAILKTDSYWHHTHDAVSETEAGMMTPAQAAAIEELSGHLDQDVKTASSPTFAGLTVGTLVINADGTIEGARFT